MLTILDHLSEFACEAVVEFCFETFERREREWGVGRGVIVSLFFQSSFCEGDDAEGGGDACELVVGIDDVVPFSSGLSVVSSEEFFRFSESDGGCKDANGCIIFILELAWSVPKVCHIDAAVDIRVDFECLDGGVAECEVAVWAIFDVLFEAVRISNASM